jgi:hypothetical protein
MTVGVYPKQLSDAGPLGTLMGQSATDLIGFYGVATPVAQRASSVQATSLISAYTSTTASALIGALLVEIANTLTGLSLWKGAA